MVTPMDKPILPDFTRWQWASLDERAWWMPKFQRAANDFKALERLSVAKGLRPAAWQFVTPNELIEATQWAHRHGLMVIPTNTAGDAGNYSTTGVAGSSMIRIVYTHPDRYKKILPWTNDDHIGEYLGFPRCCRHHFKQTWGAGQVDSTWEQWQNTRDKSPIGLAHTMLRWMGIRLVPHMPCAFDCLPSNLQAAKMYDLGCDNGYQDSMLLIKEVLNWSFEWSRLFGIAKITTPALRITTRTDWTPTLDTFKWAGTYNKPDATLWKDNGFSDPDAMESRHDILLTSLAEELPAKAFVCDLGCGNGLLLRRLKLKRGDVKIGGIEVDPAVVKRIPALSGTWHAGRIQDVLPRYSRYPDAVLLNPGRLREMTNDERIDTIIALHGVRQVFCYAYGDWTEKETLEELVASVLPGTLRMLQKTPGVSVGVLDNGTK